MKKFVLTLLFAVMSLGIVCAQEKDPKQIPANGPKISFSETTHDYGTVEKASDGNCEFEFTNKGNEPLILSNVRASCGCTAPTWSKEPIMPGQKSTIKVHYNTNNVGGFNKSITVTSNAVDNPRVVLKIKGKVQ
jgi:hypothetical protein